MERKDYADKFRKVKEEILDEILKLIPSDSVHYFSDSFYVHYIDGEVAGTEICEAVEVQNSMVFFHVYLEEVEQKTQTIGGESIFSYDPDSFLDILDHLKKDIREEKLAILREIVKKNGGSVDFDGTFNFIIHNNGDDYNCQLSGLRTTKSGELQIEDISNGERFANVENELPSDQLDKLIAYVRETTYREFVIRVYGSYSRTFDINASSYEEALAEAKRSWKINPLCIDDSNGEIWEDYTSVAR